MSQIEYWNGIIGNRIEELRKSQGLTQQVFADILNIQRVALTYYENGTRQPPIDVIVSIALYFGVSSDWLLGLSDVKSSDNDMKSTCERTGLSEDFVKSIWSNDVTEGISSSAMAVNYLSEYGDDFGLYTQIYNVIIASQVLENHHTTGGKFAECDLLFSEKYDSYINEMREKAFNELGIPIVVLSGLQYIEYLIQNAETAFSNTIRTLSEGLSDEMWEKERMKKWKDQKRSGSISMTEEYDLP